ncbi:hypothetical protein [Streptomyces boncukensis]|uniref:hypothetical protein n=1 Tax=Streptomyces boncukensis TaxID=2711219 RepID=UPI0030B9EA9B
MTITGSRTTAHRDAAAYAELFAGYLGPFAEAPGGAHFYLGGGNGIDSLALVWLAEHTRARLTVVTPAVLERQPRAARQAVARAKERIDEIVELGADPLDAAAYEARNRWMVDRSSLVIGFPVGESSGSGTWQALHYAAHEGRARLIVPI